LLLRLLKNASATHFIRSPAPHMESTLSYDLIRDRRANGSMLRILSIIDEQSQECVSLKAACSLPAKRVIDTFNEIQLQGLD
jgi:hypothetical protein